jgi:hypothetical protein
MKKLVGISLVLCVIFTAQGQMVTGLPIDINGKLNANKVVLVDGAEKAELYLRANQFYSTQFKSIEGEHMVSRGSGIMGKGSSEVWIKHGSYLTKEQLWYTVKIECKDGRYKYEIYDFFFKNKHGQLPAKDLFDRSMYYDDDGSAKDFNKAYKVEFDKAVKNLAASLEATMQTQFARN